MLIFKTVSRRVWTTRVLSDPWLGYNSNCRFGFERDKNDSWSHQKSSEWFSRVTGACQLARECQVGSIAHTSESNCESKTLLRKFATHPDANHLEGYQIFFADYGFVFGTRMSHFDSKLFGGLDDLWGEFEVAWPFRLCNRAIVKSQTTLGATSALIASDKTFQMFISIFVWITRIWDS